jgi:hypothetical protein
VKRANADFSGLRPLWYALGSQYLVFFALNASCVTANGLPVWRNVCIFHPPSARLPPSLQPMKADPILAPRLSPARPGRLFHTGMAVAFLLTALAGFGPTYFLKEFYGTTPLSPLLHLHGMVFTLWLVLLVVQSGLVAAHRVDLHKRLGIAGVVVAALMVPLGMMTAVETARRGLASAGLEPLVFMVFPVGAVIMFVGFVGAGLWQRRKPELHRRLILLGTVSILTPAIARLPVAGHNPVVALVLSLIFVLVAIFHDWKSRGRVHPLYVWGGLIILLSGPLRSAIGHTAAWQSLAGWLVG